MAELRLKSDQVNIDGYKAAHYLQYIIVSINSSNTEGQSASLVMTQQSHAQMPQQISPKPVVSNYPLLENCLKMARFNLSEHEVLQKCLIPGNSSSTVIVPARGIDYTSSLVDMDDEYLLKVQLRT